MENITKTDTNYIKIEGEIDVANVDDFYGKVKSNYDGNAGDMTIDCSELTFIDSTALGVFVKLSKELQANGAKLVLNGLAPHIKKLFTICALETIMELN